jgi:hypothetical protein
MLDPGTLRRGAFARRRWRPSGQFHLRDGAFFVAWNPTISTSSPTLTIPRSLWPVTMIPPPGTPRIKYDTAANPRQSEGGGQDWAPPPASAERSAILMR